MEEESPEWKSLPWVSKPGSCFVAILGEVLSRRKRVCVAQHLYKPYILDTSGHVLA